MSGGAYNYLCYQEAPEPHELERMAERLDELGQAHAATATRALIAPTSAWDDPLRELWRAVEWRDSADIGDYQLERALAEYAAAVGREP